MAGKRGDNGPNLIGRSTSNELVSEIGLVLGLLVVLDSVVINITQHMSRRTSIHDGEPGHVRCRHRANP